MGRHLIVDAYGVSHKKLQDRKLLYQILEHLPEKLKMRILRKPVLSKIASDSHLNFGYSGFVILMESHVSLHTWPEENFAAIDVYSCKDFNKEDAINYLKKSLATNDLKVKSIIRG